jgi:AcrR family transcriptional regulator
VVLQLDDRNRTLIERRWELFNCVAPLFREHGYRGVTLRALAHACSVSPATLYHYFDSKLALALFPISRESGLCEVMRRRQARLTDEPKTRLSDFIELLIEHREQLRLAMRLAREIEIRHERRVDDVVARAVRGGSTDLAHLLHEVAPAAPPEHLESTSEAVLRILAGQLPGMSSDASSVRGQMWEAMGGLIGQETRVRTA